MGPLAAVALVGLLQGPPAAPPASPAALPELAALQPAPWPSLSPAQARGALLSAAWALDWAQTLRIARSARAGGAWIERNPLLGPRPSERRVHLYMAGSLALVQGLAITLPQPWAERVSDAALVVELSVVQSNRALGVRYSW